MKWALLGSTGINGGLFAHFNGSAQHEKLGCIYSHDHFVPPQRVENAQPFTPRCLLLTLLGFCLLRSNTMVFDGGINIDYCGKNVVLLFEIKN